MLTKLHVENYKSLKDVSFRPEPLMVLVGANAAGKTNLVDCLEFLGQCFRDGLVEAVGSKGGYENIAFRRARRARGAIGFALTCEIDTIPKDPFWSGYERICLDYNFAFRAKKQAITSEYEVEDEGINVSWKYHGNSGAIIIDRRLGKIVFNYDHELPGLPSRDFLEQIVKESVATDELLVTHRLFVPPLALAAGFLSSIGVYQISPEAAREPGDPSGRKQLGKAGENLPAALQFLSKNDSKATRRLLRHLQNASSTFTAIETDFVETKQLGLFVKEKGVGRRWYAKDLSDGTLQTIAIFVPLVDRRLSLIAIEEPENSLHPWVIKDFIESCRVESRAKQIVITTHSPILVSNLTPNELFLVDRQEGATRVFPSTQVDANVNEIIQEGVMDLGTYWNSGQMSAVPDGPSLWDLVKNDGNGEA